MQNQPTVQNRKNIKIPTDLGLFLNSPGCIFTNRIPHYDKRYIMSERTDFEQICPDHTPSKTAFNAKHPEINQAYYTDFTRALLRTFYPKTCKCGSTEFKAISTRETELRCVRCNGHISLTSFTPAHHFKLPLWVLGYVIKEAIDLHPQPLTQEHIKRKLHVGSSSATMLKRRLQLFMSDIIPAIKALMAQDMQKDFPEGYALPSKDIDLTAEIKGKSVVFSDTVALFSASQRANGHRSRYKHNGQTSSIYLTDAVAIEKGKYQIGTLAHTLAIKQGAVIFTSIPDQKQRTVQPLLDFLPDNTPHFADEGFPWLVRCNDNYRQINHSARAKDGKRNVWARNRWSKNGVHNQVAEGNQRVLKTSMRNYSYVSPEFSQMYLDEYSGIKGLRVYGIQRVAERIFGECGGEILIQREKRARCDRYLQNLISAKKYVPRTPDLRNHANYSKTRKQIPDKVKSILKFNDYFELSQAVWDYLYFWDDSDSHRRKKEIEFNSYARRLFSLLSKDEFKDLGSIARTASLPKYHCIRIARIWHKLKIAEVLHIQRKGGSSISFKIKPLIPVLPDILYTYDKEDLADLLKLSNSIPKQEPTKHPRHPKYGMSKDKRKKLLQEKGYDR